MPLVPVIARAWRWLVDLVKNGPTWDVPADPLIECPHCGSMVEHGCDWCEPRP